ncbi:nucleotidyl transferase family protein [Cryptosporidium muris RN66]|uniref:mannose-1-phosphate guanylyltransferase n=1 Tax=Cryptosporidium muris (strain RN66) TaxID=441375 RepID=B6AEL1_CRYMR|nr:nucleotidyl transferase family protein [Cryptosporidium muris RN66]EEA06628.1 nucleotidyl transferase family protein [Cryptosporidium muris RN66]|eukprot:XP_002140977.1 nucleotidyl transferase family protein [Cryptosporidium muris RN66]
MKAIILSGGFGSRLRPLTLSKPKPIIELCNIPLIEFQISQFVEVGVKNIILAVNYLSEELREPIKNIEKKYGVKINASIEEKPLGTAGPILLAKRFIEDNIITNEPFFVCNSDIVCNFPLEEILTMYSKLNCDHQRKCEGIILVKQVEDPSKYGVVVHDRDTGLVEEFIEKPQKYIGNFINAGLYILSPSILNLIEPNIAVSIEKNIFPKIAARKSLYCLRFLTNEINIWADVGIPADFLYGTQLFLKYLQSMEYYTKKSSKLFLYEEDKLDPIVNYDDLTIQKNREMIKSEVISQNFLNSNYLNNFKLLERMIEMNKLELAQSNESYNIIENVIIHPTSQISKDCLIGPSVVIGKDCIIGRGVRLENCIIFDKTIIEDFSKIKSSIIGWNSRIGKWVRINGLSVFGEDVTINNEAFINSAIILPHKSINSSIIQPDMIIL